MTPKAAASYYRRQQSIVLKLIVALRKVWGRMDPAANWAEQYADDNIGTQLAMLVAAAQVAATKDADTYISEVLAELGIAAGTGSVLSANGLAGVTGNGYTLESVLQLAIVRAGQAYNLRAFPSDEAPIPTSGAEGETSAQQVLRESLDRSAANFAATRRLITDREREHAAEEALDEARRWVDQVAATIMADTARAAESAAAAARPEITGYVRMLTPPSCSRCAVLAGRFYEWNDGFERHPLCDCRHIPVTENVAGDLTTDAKKYFDSLSPAEQDKVFTQAGARAIRDGSDVGQVVNARRGMTTAQRISQNEAYATTWAAAVRDGVSKTEARRLARGAYTAAELPGRQRLIRDSSGLYVTDEGTTMRGKFTKLQQASIASGQPATWTRLMPESIYAIATDRDDAIRLLKLGGFITT